MKKRIQQAINNPLVSGSSVVFLGFLSSNFFNFLFNVFMSRNLTVADYGTLASLVSIILLCALVADSFLPTVVHFASTYFATEDIDKARGLFRKVTKLSLVFGGFILIIVILFGRYIGHFFNIENQSLLTLVGVSVLFASLAAMNRAFLQAKLSFTYLSAINMFSTTLKLLTGIGLVLLGFSLHGALWAFLFSYVVLYVFMLMPLKFLFEKGGSVSRIHIVTLLSYGGPATLTLLGLSSFITSDMILVKHFHSAGNAGIYAGLSLLGRIIYFFSAPIVIVMFPLIVQRHTKNEEYTHLFKIAISLTFVFSIAISLFYYLFPELIIRILLKREEYLVIQPILWFFGVYMSIYSVVFVAANFFLSVKKTKVYIPIAISAIAQASLLWFFHDSFTQIISISILTVGLLLIVLLLYYWKLYGNLYRR